MDRRCGAPPDGTGSAAPRVPRGLISRLRRELRPSGEQALAGSGTCEAWTWGGDTLDRVARSVDCVGWGGIATLAAPNDPRMACIAGGFASGLLAPVPSGCREIHGPQPMESG